ncbi:flavodoxin [Campylobacter sp. US33a]|uniref:Flavodoxin n=1 Tax=Campylobacter sp. CCS1377 TaxID=3158229 RepID=A0AAU7E8N3_9BACT|nr:flavodoxin [Campylobacter sp. US33a]MCW1359761.1 hypothetical protein [Campylobacter jejuni]TEY04596.1 hypothetical protein ELQ16_00805 [Campylobacter sp. US33a]
MNSRRQFLKQAFLLGALAYYPQLSMAEVEAKKSLIVYYSRTLNTHILAKYLQSITKSDMMRLQTTYHYPSNFEAMLEIAKQEREENFKPELLNAELNFDDYDMIFLGTPIWSGGIASPVRTFLSQYDFSSKIIAPFCTQVKDSIEGCIDDIRKIAPNAQILKGIDIHAAFEKDDGYLKDKNRIYLASEASYLTFADKQEINLWLKKM